MTDVPEIPDIGGSSDDEDVLSLMDTHDRSSFLEQDEGVLRDVLEELDRERHKRAELEAQVRVLQEELHSQRRKNSKSTKSSVRDYTQIVTERDGYKEVLDALTHDRPAFATATKREKEGRNSNISLPIHIVRLLEVMPWDTRAQQYVFGMEQVFEWQVFGADKKWLKELRQFPAFFKTLPIVVPTPGKTVNEVSRNPFGGVAPPKQCVLTNTDVTNILNIDRGYPLPDDGGSWTWVGPWRVEKSTHTDEQGWTYSNDVQVLPDPTTYYNQFRLPEKGQANIMKRRRKWMRLRVLVDYPYASNMTKAYLKLVAEKASLDVNVDKLSGQLVETKMVLMTMEADHIAFQERTNARIKELEQDLADKNKILGLVENGAGLKLTDVLQSTRSLGSTGSDKSEHKKIDKVDEIRSAVTQWVSERVEKVQKQHVMQHNSKQLDPKEAMKVEAHGDLDGSPGDTGRGRTSDATLRAEVASSSSSQSLDHKQQLFESLRDKGTGFFEVLKQKGGQELDKLKQNGGGLPWQRKIGGSTHIRDNSQDTQISTSDGTANGTPVPGSASQLETLRSANATT